MHDALAQAVREYTNSPEKSQRQVAREFNIAQATLNDELTGRHVSDNKAPNRILSVLQENVLIDKINDFASRGTLLTPRHVRSLAEGLAGRHVDKDWVGRFVRRHPDRLCSRFHTYHDLSRRQADTPETRRAWYNLVKELYDTDLYTPAGIFNMDETYFTLSDTRKVRRIGPPDQPRNTQTAPGRSGTGGEHITVVAAVGIDAACIPPLVIYKGKSLQEQWFPEGSGTTQHHATVTDSGWSNSYITKQWVENCFDPATRDRVAPGRRRLLFLDGADIHDKVDILQACWDRNIVIVILPACLTDRFQPLDVDLFNHVKAAYFRRLDDYRLATGNESAPKGRFWGWFHEAWQEAATSRQIRSAWRKAGLWPLDPAIIGAEPEQPVTPPPQPAQNQLQTPQTIRTLRSYTRQLRRGDADPKAVAEKALKGLELVIADNDLTRRELEAVREAQRLDKVARGRKRKVTHPQGQLYDLEHRESHAAELADRQARETEARRRRRAAAQATGNRQPQEPDQACTPGPSTAV